MSLRYIFGGAGYGKTSRCLEEITGRAAENPNRPLIFIVPEQFTLQSEKNLVLYSGCGAVVTAQVLSFRRLAYRIFSESGGAKGKILDDVGKSMLIRKIVNEHRESLSFFKKSLDKQGLIDNLGSLFSEFARQNIAPEDLPISPENKPSPSEEQGLERKLKDLHLIYEAYTKYIEENYISPDTELSFVPEKIAESKLLEGAEIWLDAFNGFTAQEYKIITALLAKAKRVTVTLPLKTGAVSYGNFDFTDLFYEIKSTVNRLTEAASEAGAAIEKPLLLEVCHRFNNSPELGFLEREYIKSGSVYRGKNSESISLSQERNKYLEIEGACAAIIKLVREEGYKFGDIAAVCAAVPDYERIVEETFSRYGIPVFIDSNSDILTHPLTALIRSAVDVAAYNWNYEGVFGFLKTGMTPLLRDEIDVLENYVLAYGIKGYKWELPQWEAGLSDNRRPLVNEYRSRARECLEPFAAGLNRTKRYEVKELVKRILEMLKRLNVEKKLEQMADKAISTGDYTTARAHKQIWNLIIQVLEKILELIGEEQVRVEEFGKILESGFRACDLGRIPPSLDQVMVGDLERTRFHGIKALFVLGVNEGHLPRIMGDDGLLEDEERAALKASGLNLGVSNREKSFMENFLIYSLITKPTEKLFLSWVSGDLDGKSMKPSSLIFRIRKMFPEIEIKEGGQGERPITLPKAMFRDMGALLRGRANGKALTSQERNLYNWYKANGDYAEKINTMEKIISQKYQGERLSQRTVKKLYGEEVHTSISRLERYVQCPFAYYVEYDLGARERKIYEVRPIDVGNLFHAILESFMKKISSDGLTLRQIGETEAGAYVDECIAEITPAYGGEVLISTSRDRHMLSSVGRIAKKSIWALKEHIRRGDFEPYGAELEFKTGAAITGIVVTLNGGRKLVLSGKIDRVDIMDQNGNKYVKIIDYKTGSKKFDLEDVYFGTQLQLITYLDAFIRNGAKIFGKENISGKIMPGGVFYFNIDDPILDYNDEVSEEKFQELMLKEFKMSGLVLADEVVVKGMDYEIEGHSKVIPVNLTKAGFGKNSTVASEEEFEKLRDSVAQRTVVIANEIIEGARNIYPYKKGALTGCKYCGYNVVCAIDGIEDKKYNNVKNYGKERELD